MKCGIFVSDLTVLSTLNNMYDSFRRVLSVARLERRTGGSLIILALQLLHA